MNRFQQKAKTLTSTQLMEAIERHHKKIEEAERMNARARASALKAQLSILRQVNIEKATIPLWGFGGHYY